MAMQEGRVIIALIGMAGAGKSSWASRLEAAGFTWLQCDALIADRLSVRFELGAGSVHDLGSWMGFPYDQRYSEREALYLATETAVLDAIAGDIAHGQYTGSKLIVDLTGSAIYVDSKVLGRLREQATVVYLAVSPRLHDQMVRDYLANPRPIVWNGLYQPLPHEDPAAALERCYPQLLAERERRYAEISDVVLDDAQHRDPAFGVDDFLRYVKQRS